MTSAVLKSFLVEVKLYTLFFPLCPFNSFGRGQHSWALKHLEGHSVHEFVLAFISAFFILFYPLPRGHFDWHGSQVKRSAYSKGHVCHRSVRITFLCLMRSDFFPNAVLLGDLYCFPGPVSITPCLPHSPSPFGSISSDQETWCQRPKIHLNMVTSGLRLAGDYD